MQRRKFLGFTLGLPFGIKAVETLDLQEHDLLVVTYDDHLPNGDIRNAQRQIHNKLGHDHFIMLPSSIKMTVIKKGHLLPPNVISKSRLRDIL